MFWDEVKMFSICTMANLYSISFTFKYHVIEDNFTTTVSIQYFDVPEI